MARSTPHTRVRTLDDEALAEAAQLILGGDCVAIATETVYGLAADATSDAAVARIYRAKGRPSFNPLIVHISDLAMAESLAVFSDMAHMIANAFWPGPLTLVLPLHPEARLAAAVTAGLATVALRCPAHPAIRGLIAATKRPLAAPSANASGSVSPTRATHVLATLDRVIPLIIDAGACSGGIESTIISVTGDGKLSLLRPGPITIQMMEAVTGLRPQARGDKDGITAPGQLASHYAPGKPMLLNCTLPPADAYMIGFGDVSGDTQLSESGDLREAAAALFAALHAGRQSAKPRIAVAPIPSTGVGIAINDRLTRAAA